MPLLELIAPVRCVACRVLADGDLCADCALDVHVAAPACVRCGGPERQGGDGRCVECRALDGFRRARSVLRYAPAPRALVVAAKRRGRRRLASDIGILLAAVVRKEGLASPGIVVTFVPAGRSARARGFDHAQLLARATAEALDAPCRRLVVRAAEGPRQADVPLSGRRRNVRGRFAGRPARGPVLLVDDVFTTGSTAEACSLALLAAGATSVDVVTFARTPRTRPV